MLRLHDPLPVQAEKLPVTLAVGRRLGLFVPGQQLFIPEQAQPEAGDPGGGIRAHKDVGIAAHLGMEAPQPAVHRQLGEAAGIQAVKLVQKLGLPLVPDEQYRRHGDVVGQRPGDLSGERVVVPQLAGDGDGLPAADQDKLRRHALHERPGHRPGGHRHRVGPVVGVRHLGALLRRQGVLALQDVLHPLGDAVNLAVHVVADLAHVHLQVLGIVIKPVQPGEQVGKHPDQHDRRQSCQHKGPPPPFFGPLRSLIL